MPVTDESLGLPQNTSRSPGKNNFPIELALFICSILFAAIPIAISLRVEGLQSIFGYFAADTFFYLAVAKHSGWAPIFSFDGIYPTNGFHPLWQFILKLASQGLQLGSQEMIKFAFVFSAFCITTASTLIVLTTNRILRRPVIALFSVFPGFIYLISVFASPIHGNPWSFVNGMESPLSLLLFAIVIFLTIQFKIFSQITSGRILKLLVLSFLLALIVLARLDDIFLVIGFALSSALLSSNKKDKLIKPFLLCIIPFLLTICYLFFNYSYADSPLPVSAVAKAGISLKDNIIDGINLFVPTLYLPANSWGWWRELSYRSILLNMPAFAAILFLVKCYPIIRDKLIPGRLASNDTTTMHKDTPSTGLFLAITIYIILKWLYNLINVELWHQGHWYFPLSIASANLIIAYLISGLIPKRYLQPGHFILLLLLLWSLNLYISNGVESYKASSNYNRNYYRLWSNRERVTKELINLDPNAKVIEFDDGIISYSLDVPVMSGLGFALDKDALESKRKGNLLTKAKSRGFNYLSSLNYMPKDISQAFYLGNESGDWEFIKVIDDKPSGLSIYKFRPR